MHRHVLLILLLSLFSLDVSASFCERLLVRRSFWPPVYVPQVDLRWEALHLGREGRLHVRQRWRRLKLHTADKLVRTQISDAEKDMLSPQTVVASIRGGEPIINFIANVLSWSDWISFSKEARLLNQIIQDLSDEHRLEEPFIHYNHRFHVGPLFNSVDVDFVYSRFNEDPTLDIVLRSTLPLKRKYY